jgi:hypothetical protein
MQCAAVAAGAAESGSTMFLFCGLMEDIALKTKISVLHPPAKYSPIGRCALVLQVPAADLPRREELCWR